MTIKITLTILFTLFFFNIIGQTIKENNKDVPFGPDNKQKLVVLIDNLSGEWEFVKKINKNGDTISIDTSSIPMYFSNVNPITIIKFDKLQNFKITQICMQGDDFFASGRYTIEMKTLKDLPYFYLTFQGGEFENLIGKLSDFNGFLTNFQNNTFQLKDNNGCDWIYKRLK